MNEVDEDSIHGDRILAEVVPVAAGAIPYNQRLTSSRSSVPDCSNQVLDHGARL
jgi:hypothetical protein